MAKSLNRWQGIGRLARDPETRFMPDQTPVCKFTIACDDDYRDRGGNKVDAAEFVPLVAFGKLADICAQYLTKGKEVFVEGKFTTRKWQDERGVDRWTTEVKLENMQMLGSRNDGGAGRAPDAAPAGRRQAPPAAPQGIHDDDIPFG